MKESRYNLYFTLGDFHFVYNLLTGSLVKTDKEGIKAIQEVREEKLALDTAQQLEKNGIWFNDDVDESKIIQVLHEYYKYSGRRAYICTYVTFNCNLSCEYCYLKYFTKGKTFLSMNSNTAERLAEFAKNVVYENNCNELITVFTGGESLLNISAILRIITRLEVWSHEQDVKYQSIVFSNGTLLSEDIIDKFIKHNVFFQITLSGVKDIHDRKRPYENGRGSYEDIMRALTILKDYKISFGIRVDVDTENLSSIRDMLDDIIERAGKGLYIKFFPILPGAKIACSWTNKCFKINDLRKLSTLWNLASERGFKVMETPLVKYVYCEYHTNRGYIVDPDGDLYKCAVALGNKELKIGSLDPSGKLIGLNYQYYEWMSRNPLLIEKCKNCKFLPACGGGCAGVSYDTYGTYHKGDCREKFLILERIKFYLKEVVKSEKL